MLTLQAEQPLTTTGQFSHGTTKSPVYDQQVIRYEDISAQQLATDSIQLADAIKKSQ